MITKNKNYALLSFDLGFATPLVYKIPQNLKKNINIGQRVLAPVRKKSHVGIALDILDKFDSSYEIKELTDIIDPSPVFEPEMINLIKWVSEYYHYPLNRIFHMVLPKNFSLKPKRFVKILNKKLDILNIPKLTKKESILLTYLTKKKTVLEDTLKKNYPDFDINKVINGLTSKNLIEIRFADSKEKQTKQAEKISLQRDNIRLTKEQNIAYNNIIEKVTAREFKPFLLHGITGSGKTEVYIKAIKHALKNNLNSMVLVPEISLTPQLIERFRKSFGDKISVLHSAQLGSERFAEWQDIYENKARVVIGVRSAIFAPLRHIGLIVIDEEHETSYKQDSNLLYNARDVAIMRAKFNSCPIVLGSATPQIESYHNIYKKNYDLLNLPKRIRGSVLPEVTIVDMKEESKEFGEKPIISALLRDEIEINLSRNLKTILFLNRRGFASLVLCKFCGNILKCPNCSVGMTYHNRDKSLVCHYCSLTTKFSTRCSICREDGIITLGIGTQKVEEEIKNSFPDAKVLRMDSDTTKTRGSHDIFFKKFRDEDVDILIGTQMITKGLDIPTVTLVGVIYADLSLNLPDFRAAERTFQLVTQVAGRAGRGSNPGKVIVQTFNPDHYSILLSKNQDFLNFYNQEIEYRKELNYPPFSRLANIRINGEQERQVIQTAKMIAENILKYSKKNLELANDIAILGPSACPIEKKSNRYRWQIIIKSKSSRSLSTIGKLVAHYINENPSKHIRIKVDIDPISFF